MQLQVSATLQAGPHCSLFKFQSTFAEFKQHKPGASSLLNMITQSCDGAGLEGRMRPVKLDVKPRLGGGIVAYAGQHLELKTLEGG